MAENEKYRSILEGPQIDDALQQMNLRIPEGWAVGTRDGVPVDSSSEFYHNNAKYWAQLAQGYAQNAETFVAKFKQTPPGYLAQAISRSATILAVDPTSGNARKETYIYTGLGRVNNVDYYIFVNVSMDMKLRFMTCATSGSASSAWGVVINPIQLVDYPSVNEQLNLKAPLASPILTGIPTAPTATEGDNSTQIANTAFVHGELGDAVTELSIAINGKANKSEVALKADQNGNYPEMSVGTAEQILSSIHTTDTTPYTYRQTGGGVEVGNREDVKSIIGASLGWNQLVQNGNFADTSNWTAQNFTSSASGNIGVFTASAQTTQFVNQNRAFASGHKYFVTLMAKASVSATLSISANSASFQNAVIGTESITTDWKTFNYIVTADNYYNAIHIGFRVANVIPNGEALSLANVMVTDITLALGSTVADYVYTQESGTAGAGVALLKKWGIIDGKYKAYDAGSIQSVSVTAHKTTGVNLWDESAAVWENGKVINASGALTNNASHRTDTTYTRIMGGEDITVSLARETNTGVGFAFYDTDKTFLERIVAIVSSSSAMSATITAPVNAAYFRVYIGLNSTNMQLEYGTTPSAYEPYTVHTYPLNANGDLRGILKLDANNNLYSDGDVYTADGTVTVKYGVVDLGTLTWAYNTTSLRFSTTGLSSVIKKPATSWGAAQGINLLTSGIFQNGEPTDDLLMDIYYNGNIYCKDAAYTDKDAFKAAMDGVYLLYPIDAPTTRTADPYQEIQICANGGTEEYTQSGSVPVPVGHETIYYKDIVKAIEGIPPAPSANGTYTLQVTVSGGVATYSWA